MRDGNSSNERWGEGTFSDASTSLYTLPSTREVIQDGWMKGGDEGEEFDVLTLVVGGLMGKGGREEGDDGLGRGGEEEELTSTLFSICLRPVFPLQFFRC